MTNTCSIQFGKLWIGLAVLAFAGQLSAQGLPSQEEILAKMTLANDYFMDKWPDPTAPIVHPDRTRPSNIWTRSTYYEGLMALYYVDNQPAYYNYAVDWGEGHNWEPAYGGTTTRNADNQCAGQTYIELYQLDPQPERIAPIKATIDNMVNSPVANDWWWIDALQMAMPVFAKLGAVYDDDRYFEKLFDLYNYTKTQRGGNGLYNTADHLWWRDDTFDPPYAEPNGEDCYWSRGNGWVLAGLARVLDVMPMDAPHRDEYVTTFQDMAAALVPIQREDGFWNVSLHDPTHFGGKETSGTAFFTFGLAWGVNNGLLVGEQYRTAAIQGWNGMANDALHPDGFLGYVQGTGKEPASAQPVTYDSVPNFEDFGLGAFLLAGSEVYQLADAVILAGDYNRDGLVDASDYTVWRDNLDTTSDLWNDPIGGTIGQPQYDQWKANYGAIPSPGAASGRTAVPEPAASLLALIGLTLLFRDARRSAFRALKGHHKIAQLEDSPW